MTRSKGLAIVPNAVLTLRVRARELGGIVRTRRGAKARGRCKRDVIAREGERQAVALAGRVC